MTQQSYLDISLPTCRRNIILPYSGLIIQPWRWRQYVPPKLTFTYHDATRCNNTEALYMYRQFNSVDMTFFLTAWDACFAEKKWVSWNTNDNRIAQYLWVLHFGELFASHNGYCTQTVMAETQMWRIDPFVLQWMDICHAMVVTSCHIRILYSMLGQFAWLIWVVSVNTPVINWYLVNGFKETSMFVSVTLLRVPPNVTTARIA
jgi:hypothetical protein